MNDKLSTDISSLEGKLMEIKSKVEAAKNQQKMNQMAERAGVANQDEMFTKMNEKADYMLDRANAMAELDGTVPVRDFSEVEELADKYDRMDNGTSVQAAADEADENPDSNDGTIDIL